RASLQMGDPKAALDSYRLGQKTYDDVPQWYYARSDAYVRLNAERGRTHAKRQMGKCYQQLGQFAEARKLLAAALNARVARPPRGGMDAPAALRYDVVLSRWDMGDLELLIEGDPFAALGYYRPAALSAEALTKREAGNPFYVHAFAYADYRMGVAYLRV